MWNYKGMLKCRNTEHHLSATVVMYTYRRSLIGIDQQFWLLYSQPWTSGNDKRRLGYPLRLRRRDNARYSASGTINHDKSRGLLSGFRYDGC